MKFIFCLGLVASGNFINLTFIILKYGVGLNDVIYFTVL